MVKGVSKMVIEVNNTGSELFEKVVFYVTPKYGNLSAKQLKRAASSFSFNYDTLSRKSTLRKKYRWRKKRIIAILAALIVIAAVAIIIIM